MLYANFGLANRVLLTPLAKRSHASVTIQQHSSILLTAAEGIRQTSIHHDFQSELYEHIAQRLYKSMYMLGFLWESVMHVCQLKMFIRRHSNC